MDVIPSKYIFLSIPFYSNHFPEELKRWELRAKKNQPNVNFNTISHFQKLWTRNYIINLSKSANSNISFLNPLTVSLKNQILVFAGASPELEEDIEKLKKFRNKYFLLSSDTSFATLVDMGISPDAVLSIDSGRGTSFHFRLNLPDHIPIFTWFGANRILFERKNPLYIYLSSFPLDQFLNQLIFPSQPILQNPSLNITGMAKSIASYLGVRKMLLTGVSFLSKNRKTHCRGTGYENYYLPTIKRMRPMESIQISGYKTVLNSKNKLAFTQIFSDDYVTSFSEYNWDTISDIQSSFRPNPILSEKILYSFHLWKDPNYSKFLQKEIGLSDSFWKKLLLLI